MDQSPPIRAPCHLKPFTICSASSWLRVTRSSFQLEGRREPACFTSRCDARTCAGAVMPTLLLLNLPSRKSQDPHIARGHAAC